VRYHQKFSNLSIDFRYIREFEHKLDFDISIAVFRIAQEGLNNIVKHAGATNVILHVLDKEDEIYFILEDNGRGFDEKTMLDNPGSGLKNIRERVMLLNGVVEIHASPGRGASIEIHIPIKIPIK
jgi:signal transduction histidine kinase